MNNNGLYTMMAKSMKSLALLYPMIQFLIILTVIVFNNLIMNANPTLASLLQSGASSLQGPHHGA